MIIRAIFILLILNVFCNEISAQRDTSYNLLWKIKKEGIPSKGYLFGTMHVADERAFDFADSVMLALDECDVFAIEVHPDSIILATLELMMEADTVNYFKKNMLDSEYENFLKEFSKKNKLDFEDLDSKHPLNINTFDRRYKGRTDKSTFVDLHLYGVAKTLDKEIIGLEPIENQLEIIYKRTLKRARIGIKQDSVLERLYLNQLLESYNKGNLEDMNEVLGNGFTDSKWMIKRNRDMVQTIMNTLDQRSLFAAVGAGHLMGSSSIISMLKENGYKVERVKPTFTGVAENYKIDSANIPWEILVDVKGGYQIKFPRDFLTLDRSIPYHSEIGLDTLNVRIRLKTDLTNMRNVIISYSDFPTGYYLESRASTYEMIEEELVSQGSRITSFEDVEHMGNEGRLYRILVRGNYHLVLHVFVRGNRVYRIIDQNLTAGKKIKDEKALIRNLKLLPYAKSTIKQKRFRDFSLPYFNRGIMEIDDVLERNTFLKNGFTWYANDPTTGNTLTVSVYGIKDLLSINNLDSFYKDYAYFNTSWNDTIVSAHSISEGGIKGYETLTSNQYGDAYIRSRYWFSDSHAILYSIYSDSIGVYCDNSNSFITAKLIDEALSQKKLLENKTPQIITDLYSADSLVSAAAIDALQYNTIYD